MKQHSVKEYMTELPHTAGKNIPIEKAEEMMENFGCHHLPVLEGGHLVGVVSARDVAIMRLGERRGQQVSDVMAEDPLVVDPDSGIKEVAREMLKLKVGSAIVRAKDGKPWGIFTVTDALKVVAELL